MQMPSTRRIRQILAVAIVTACVALAGAVAVRQYRAVPTETASRPISPNVDMAMTVLRFSEMSGDAKLWELVADRADYDKEPGLVQLAGVRLDTFEGKSGGVAVTSRTGSYDEKKRLVTMSGAVHAVTRRGMVLDSEAAEYRPASGILTTDQSVTVRDGRMRLTALGAELSMKDEKVRFLRQVDAVIEGKHAKQ